MTKPEINIHSVTKPIRKKPVALKELLAQKPDAPPEVLALDPEFIAAIELREYEEIIRGNKTGAWLKVGDSLPGGYTVTDVIHSELVCRPKWYEETRLERVGLILVRFLRKLGANIEAIPGGTTITQSSEFTAKRPSDGCSLFFMHPDIQRWFLELESLGPIEEKG